VIRSHDFDLYPVRVLLAEATPERLADLIALLDERGMRFVTFDGLNAWFTSSTEYDELAPKLALPASPVLDWFHPAVYLRMLSEQHAITEELQRTIAELTEQREVGDVSGQRPRAWSARVRTYASRLGSNLRRSAKG
jgi:hypothetical protein